MSIDELNEHELELRWRLIREGFSAFADVARMALKHIAEKEGIDPERLTFHRTMDWTVVQIGDRPLLKFKELVVFDEEDHWSVKWVVSKDI